MTAFRKWDVELEAALFDGIEHFTPIGPTKHFAVQFLQWHLLNRLGIKVPAKEILNKLGKYWHIDALDPDFSMKNGDKDDISKFDLPSDYDDLIDKIVEDGTLASETPHLEPSEPQPKGKASKSKKGVPKKSKS